MRDSHLQRSDCGDFGSIEPNRQEHLNARLELAVQAIDLSWIILSEAARDFDIDVEKPVLEDATGRGYFETMKWEALELADAIYWSVSDAARRKDDGDLERFESTVISDVQFSPRVHALALLTIAKGLVESPIAEVDHARSG